MLSRYLSRRTFLRVSALGATAALAACAPRVVKETVEVVKEKEVTKVVAQTVVVAGTPQVVQKEVTKIVEVAAKTAEEMLPKQDKLGSPDHAKGWKTILPALPAGMPFKAPVVITCSRRVDAQTKFCNNETLENNPWSRMIKALFNIEYKVQWTWSTGDEANQKYNLALASGDMPEFSETMPQAIFVKGVEAGAFQEVGPAYDQYASPRWKAIWREYGESPWVWTKINGKIWGISKPSDVAHDDCVLWYRQDWVEKAGAKPPTTFQELHDLALVFAKGEYGAGAKGTTYGLLANNAYPYTWFGSIDFIWGGFGYFPNQWQPEGDGLMYGGIRPECKEALALLAQWYKDGVFRKDFYSIDPSKSMQDVASNIVGLNSAPSWGASLDSVKNDPKAKWNFVDIPIGPKGFRRRHTSNPFGAGPFAWKKGFNKWEAIFVKDDWWDQLWRLPYNRMHGWEVCNYIWKDGNVAESTGISYQNWTPGIIGTRGAAFLDPKGAAAEISYRYDEWTKVPPEKQDAMMVSFLNDPNGVNEPNNKSRLRIVETADVGVMTKLQTSPTPTQIERGVDMGKLQDETYIGIWTGQKPLSDFDVFVENWKKAGGAQSTKEVNEWWAKQAK